VSQQPPESDKREDAALLRRIVLLSLPSFIGPGLFWFLIAMPSDGRIAAALERIPHYRFVFVIAYVAVCAQVFTLPLAAFTLYQELLRGPSGNREAAVALVCICLAGLYASFGWLF